MSVQLNIFMLLFGGLQGLLFSLFLRRKKIHQGGYIFLLLYLGVILLQLTLKVMSKIGLMEHWSLIYSIAHYLPLLYGPLAYLFMRDMLHKDGMNKKTLLHFLPFFLVLCGTALENTEVISAGFSQLFYNPYTRLLILGMEKMLSIKYCKERHYASAILATKLYRLVVRCGAAGDCGPLPLIH